MAPSSGYNDVGGAVPSTSWKLLSTDLVSKRVLGKGVASIVYETRLGGVRCARKDFMGVPSKIFEEEAKKLVPLKHDNIVKTHGWTVDKMSCSLVVEYVEDDLLAFLQHKKKSQGILASTALGLHEAIGVMLQIAQGVAFLHDQGIVHGDLKTSNILVTQATSKKSPVVKVADFGLVQTKRMSIPFVSRPARKLDMVQWKGPEYFSHVSDDNEESSDSDLDKAGASSFFDISQSQACDVYSYALICYQILTGKQPYPDWNWKVLGAKIAQGHLRPRLPSSCPTLLANLLEQCWDGHQDLKRPTFIEICGILEQVRLLVLQSMDHASPITGVLKGSSNDVIATQDLAIASSSKDYNIEIENESHVSMGTSLGRSMEIRQIEGLQRSEDEKYEVFPSHCGPETLSGFINWPYVGLDVPSSDFIATQDFDVASSREDLDIQMKNEVVVKPSTLAESALKRLRRIEGLSKFIMGDPLVSPSGVGFAVNALLKGLVKIANLADRHKDLCKELANKLGAIEPIVTSLGQSAIITKHAKCIEWLMQFHGTLVSAHALMNDCLLESRLDKMKRMLKFWRWKRLPSLLTRINTQIDKAMKDTTLFTWDVVPLVSARKFSDFAEPAIPPLIVGVEGHFTKLKTSILQSSERMDGPSAFGLCGSGGAGKTLLAQMLKNDYDIKRTYGEDSIVWISVGLDASVGDLYERMGKCSFLDGNDFQRLKLMHNDEDKRALFIESFSKKKILLILDDVWEQKNYLHDMMYWLDVAKAPGSAMLITTRSEAILQRARAEVNVVLSLDGDDSWKLFSFHAFIHEGTSSTTIPERLAKAICKECKGVPLALKVIGSAMVDKESIEKWESALFELQQPTSILDSSVYDDLFGRLSLSYKGLKNDATRICFLYFAAFPKDHKIEVENLINIWVGEGLFGLKLSTKEAKKIAYDHLRVLVKRSLIDWNQEEKYVYIHDVLRDLALYIINTAVPGQCAYECLFHSQKSSMSLPTEERVVGLKRISFMGKNIAPWPKRLQIACREVKVCLLQHTTIMEMGAPSDFFSNMINLRVLDLSRNSSISQLPKSIGNLEHLTELDLSNCGSLKWLSESIGNLKCLTALKLSACASLMGLPKGIGNLKHLTELDLSGCGSLTGLPESMGNLKCLTRMYLQECGSLTMLPDGIGNLERLTELNLSNCKLLTKIPESIAGLKYLTELNLSKCGSLTMLPDSIGNLERLTVVKLSACAQLMSLPKSIGNLKQLKELDLSGCGSLAKLPESINNMKCLARMYLQECGSLRRLPENIGNLKGLTILDLTACASLMELPESTGNLKCLTVLKLSACASLKGLPTGIGNLKRLITLNLLDCGSLTSLPKGIKKLKYLTVLELSACNSLMGLPKSIGGLKCLTVLDLSECGSLKRLPDCIGDLKYLITLYLQECGSLMKLPESIGNLRCLTLLDLSECGSLMGLPESIGNLKCLTELNLSKCRALEMLPKSIGNLECLTVLDLSACGSLTGLPESMGNLEQLKKLNLRDCKALEGLGQSIGNLKYLTLL